MTLPSYEGSWMERSLTQGTSCALFGQRTLAHPYQSGQAAVKAASPVNGNLAPVSGAWGCSIGRRPAHAPARPTRVRTPTAGARDNGPAKRIGVARRRPRGHAARHRHGALRPRPPVEGVWLTQRRCTSSDPPHVERPSRVIRSRRAATQPPHRGEAPKDDEAHGHRRRQGHHLQATKGRRNCPATEQNAAPKCESKRRAESSVGPTEPSRPSRPSLPLSHPSVKHAGHRPDSAPASGLPTPLATVAARRVGSETAECKCASCSAPDGT
jgi:hypothetical protein